MTSAGLSKPRTARVGSFFLSLRRVAAHWRPIVLLLILARVAFLVARSDEFGRFELIDLAMLLIFIASQIFWLGRLVDVGERFIPRRPRRVWLAIIAALVYSFVFLYSYSEWGLSRSHIIWAADYRPQSVLIHAAFWWWFVGSMAAFLLVIVFGAADRAARAAEWVYRKVRSAIHQSSGAADAEGVLLSSGRRRFLERTAVLVSATPFVAAGYGLLYERQNVEVVRQRIRLARLPKAFEGFRIAQLSDIHLGPFTTADYIRRCVAITNGLEPDLIALTGDYVCWDPKAQSEVVRVLAGLRAPHGVFGCMGNHEADVGIEDSITRLFAAQGIRMLRQERAPIRRGDETLNLIGIDHGSDLAPDAERQVEGDRRLQRLKALVMPNTVNILLIHYPHAFGDHELGIDLTLSGDIHGGQLSLDFIHRGLNLGSLVGVPYIRGLYKNGGEQLYMNRGIGITGFPIRFGARPEITVLELARA
ncbi:MAG TPA: metallophosphoesterase [Terriglobales bacterium]|nr:metallophosphoesterase [Terriglobales bacterium]